MLIEISAFNLTLLCHIGQRINDIVDFDQSAVMGTFTVKPMVNARLDELRNTYDALPEYLSHVVHELAIDIPGLNVVYFPQLGFLITIPTEHSSLVPSNCTLQV